MNRKTVQGLPTESESPKKEPEVELIEVWVRIGGKMMRCRDFEVVVSDNE